MPTTRPTAMPTSMTPNVSGASTCSNAERKTSTPAKLVLLVRGGDRTPVLVNGAGRNDSVGQREPRTGEEGLPRGYRLAFARRARLRHARVSLDPLPRAACVDHCRVLYGAGSARKRVDLAAPRLAQNLDVFLKTRSYFVAGASRRAPLNIS